MIDNEAGVTNETVVEKIRRRGLLGGVAMLAGLAGCGGSSNRPEESDPENKSRQETQETAQTDGETTQTGVPTHNHGGTDSGGETLTPNSVETSTLEATQAQIGRINATRADARTTNGVVNVAAYPGDDLGERWNAAIEAEGQVGNHLWHVPPGEYRLTTPVDLTGGRFDGLTRGVGVDCRGAFITLATAGSPAFDLSDAGNLRFDAGLMISDPDAAPSVGLLVGDENPRGGPEGRQITGTMLGAYEVATVYVHGREHVVIDDARLRNADDTGHVVAASAGNALDVQTPFGTLSRESSVQNLTIRGSKLFSVNAAGDAVCLFEGRTPHLVVRDTELASMGEPHVEFDLQRERTMFATFESLRMRPWFPDNPTSAVGFRVKDGGRGAELRDVALRDIFFSGANASREVTAPFFEAIGDVSMSDLTLDGRVSLRCGNPGIDIVGDLSESDLRIENKQLRVGGDLRNTRVHGKFSPDGFGLNVSGNTQNVLYWSHDDNSFQNLGGQIG